MNVFLSANNFTSQHDILQGCICFNLAALKFEWPATLTWALACGCKLDALAAAANLNPMLNMCNLMHSHYCRFVASSALTKLVDNDGEIG